MHVVLVTSSLSSIYLFHSVFQSATNSPSIIILNTFFALLHACSITGAVATLASKYTLWQACYCENVLPPTFQNFKGNFNVFLLDFLSFISMEKIKLKLIIFFQEDKNLHTLGYSSYISAEMFVTITTLFCCVVNPFVFPLGLFAFPCAQFSSRLISYFNPQACSLFSFQIVTYFVEVVLFFIPLLLWGFSGIIFTITIDKWIASLKALLLATKIFHKSKNRCNQWETVTLYRNCQVYTTILNQFSQPYLLPNIQVFGAGCITMCSYNLMLYHEKMPILISVPWVIFTLTVALFCLGVLDICSKDILYSKGCLTSMRKWSLYKNKLFRRYIKSLSCLKLYTGPFHAVDRKRAPSLIKYYLQRTMFLVFKSRAV